jgi:hypothetical protein
MGFFGLDSIYFCMGPTDRGWRRGSPYRGDGEGFIVHGEKKGGYRGSAVDGEFPST